VPYDEALAERVREALARRRGIAEKRMFGGLAFLHRGHMACGVLGTELVLRLGGSQATRALRRAHVRPMDFTGRPMKGMVYVAAPGYRTAAALRAWLDRALAFTGTLPPK